MFKNITIIGISFFMLYCKSQSSADLGQSPGYNSKEALVAAVFSAIETGDFEQVASQYVGEEFFNASIYPKSREGRNPGAWQGSEWFNAMFKNKRINNLSFHLQKKLGKTYTVKEVKSALKLESYENVTWHKWNEVTYESESNSAPLETKQIFGVIVQVDDKFYWLNTFQD